LGGERVVAPDALCQLSLEITGHGELSVGFEGRRAYAAEAESW